MNNMSRRLASGMKVISVSDQRFTDLEGLCLGEKYDEYTGTLIKASAQAILDSVSPVLFNWDISQVNSPASWNVPEGFDAKALRFFVIDVAEAVQMFKLAELLRR